MCMCDGLNEHKFRVWVIILGLTSLYNMFRALISLLVWKHIVVCENSVSLTAQVIKETRLKKEEELASEPTHNC